MSEKKKLVTVKKIINVVLFLGLTAFWLAAVYAASHFIVKYW